MSPVNPCITPVIANMYNKGPHALPQVIVEKGHKWANLEYQSHLDLLEYFPYMYGGGYIVSADVATTLVQVCVFLCRIGVLYWGVVLGCTSMHKEGRTMHGACECNEK